MYVITGATGNTGWRITERLLSSGKKVRAIGRDAKRLQPLAGQGADPFVGSLDDREAMNRAFQGARAAYLMIPPHYAAEDFRAYQNRISETLATAVANAGVRYVVSLSSVGAHKPTGVGPIGGLHSLEQRLNKIDAAHVLHLRPAFFMENFLFSIDVIKRMGIAGGPLREDLVIPMIAIRDVADYAAERLLKLDFEAHSSRELLGQRDLAIQEAVQALGKAIGRKQLPYLQFEYDDYAKSMREAGFSATAAELMTEMYRAFNEGILKPTEPRSPNNTTPTPIEDFAKVFAAVYNQGESGAEDDAED